MSKINNVNNTQELSEKLSGELPWDGQDVANSGESPLDGQAVANRTRSRSRHDVYYNTGPNLRSGPGLDILCKSFP